MGKLREQIKKNSDLNRYRITTSSSSKNCVAFLQFFFFALLFSGNTTCLPPAVSAVPSVTLQTRLSGAATQGIAGEAPAKDLLLTTLGNMSSFSWQFRPPPYSKPWPWCSTPSVLMATRQSAGDVRKLSATWEPVQPTSHLPTVVTSKVTSCNCKIKYLSVVFIFPGNC